MARSNRSNSLWIASAVAALLLLIPAATEAQGKIAQGTWLAAAAASPAAHSSWGRLTVKDGLLTFASTKSRWQKPLNEIKRISASRHGQDLMEIESQNGDVLFVAILGPQMLKESPRKAMQIIERAVREAPAARPTVLVAAGGSSS